ncbi:MAG: GNAT family N-acetyltransferase [Geminicoccaceae bacterium]
MSSPLRFINDALVIRAARSSDAGTMARVYVDTWRDTYRGLVPQAYLDSMSYAGHERRWRQTFAAGGWGFIAEVDRRTVGFASGGRCRSGGRWSGELFVLYVLRPWQGHGVGRALFDATHYELARRGHSDMLVWVLATNPARRFYEHLGGEPAGENVCEIGGARLRELAYGWRD